MRGYKNNYPKVQLLSKDLLVLFGPKILSVLAWLGE